MENLYFDSSCTGICINLERLWSFGKVCVTDLSRLINTLGVRFMHAGRVSWYTREDSRFMIYFDSCPDRVLMLPDDIDGTTSRSALVSSLLEKCECTGYTMPRSYTYIP